VANGLVLGLDLMVLVLIPEGSIGSFGMLHCTPIVPDQGPQLIMLGLAWIPTLFLKVCVTE